MFTTGSIEPIRPSRATKVVFGEVASAVGGVAGPAVEIGADQVPAPAQLVLGESHSGEVVQGVLAVKAVRGTGADASVGQPGQRPLDSQRLSLGRVGLVRGNRADIGHLV